MWSSFKKLCLLYLVNTFLHLERKILHLYLTGITATAASKLKLLYSKTKETIRNGA